MRVAVVGATGADHRDAHQVASVVDSARSDGGTARPVVAGHVLAADGVGAELERGVQLAHRRHARHPRG